MISKVHFEEAGSAGLWIRVLREDIERRHHYLLRVAHSVGSTALIVGYS